MNILVIRTHRLGDVLQLTPMLQGLKKKYPSSKITFLTGRDMVDLLSGNPHVDEVVSIPEKEYRWYLKNRSECYPRIYNEVYDLISELRERGFQLIINRQYEVGGILAWLVGAEEIRGGSFSPDRGFIFEDDVSRALFETIRRDRKTNHRNLVDWACHIAGLPSGCGGMTFDVPEMDRWEAKALLHEGGVRNGDPLVAVHMGAARSFRQWGAENYARIIKWLVKERDKRVVLLGTNDERSLAETVHHNLGEENSRVIDLIGKTGLKTLGGVLERCQCLISGDTGAMHMATAVRTPVLAIFYGTAYPWETGPYGTGHFVIYADEPCAPCLHPDDCAFAHKCRRSITSERVCKAFEIAQAMTQGESLPFPWPRGDVHLFMTNNRHGFEQTLVPINEIQGVQEGISSLIDILKAGDSTEHGRAFDPEVFKAKGDLIIRNFYRGDRQYFLDTFSEYVDQWSKLVAYANGVQLGEDSSEIFSKELAPAINEACQALQSDDLVTIVDLIQYKFTSIVEQLEHVWGIGHSAWSMEHRACRTAHRA